LETGFAGSIENNSRMNNIIGNLQLMWLMMSPPALFSRLFGLPWYRDTLDVLKNSGLASLCGFA